MANWVKASCGHPGFDCNDCGAYVNKQSLQVEVETDCLNNSCKATPKLEVIASVELPLASPNGICECGFPEADAGPIGVYCTNPHCPVERRIMQSFIGLFLLKRVGVSRVEDNDKALLVSFNRKPTDDELRDIHERLREL